MKKLKNAIICTNSDFPYLKYYGTNKLYKQVVKTPPKKKIDLIPDSYCAPNRAYLFDNKGIMHTIIIKR